MSDNVKINCSDLERLVVESIGKILNESLSRKIYHFTSIKSAFDIVKSNEMFCQSALAGSSDNLDKRYKFYISFTRSKSPLEGFGYNSSRGMSTARIEFDGEILSNNFRGKAVNYWNSDVLMNKHNYMKRALTDKAYEYVPYDGDDVPTNVKSMPKTMLRWVTDASPEYVKSDGKVYVKQRTIPDEIKHHQDNEIEDRLFTNMSVINNIGKYITRIDILVDKNSESNDIKYAKLMSYMQNVFIYDNIKDFAAQSDNTINEWLSSSNEISASIEPNMLGTSSYCTVQLLTKFLELITLDSNSMKGKFKHAARFLDSNGLGDYKGKVFKNWNRWGTNLRDAISQTSAYMSNVSKSPSRDGQKILDAISKYMTRHGYTSFKDMYDKLTAIGTVNKDIKKEFTILKLDYNEYDVTDPSSVDVWYILGLKNSINARRSFFYNVAYELERNGWFDKGLGGYNKFLRYCNTLSTKELSLEKFNSIFGKVGLDFYKMLDMYGLSYSVENKNLDYYEFTVKGIEPPFAIGKDGYTTYNQKINYAVQVFNE